MSRSNYKALRDTLFMLEASTSDINVYKAKDPELFPDTSDTLKRHVDRYSNITSSL